MTLLCFIQIFPPNTDTKDRNVYKASFWKTYDIWFSYDQFLQVFPIWGPKRSPPKPKTTFNETERLLCRSNSNFKNQMFLHIYLSLAEKFGWNTKSHNFILCYRRLLLLAGTSDFSSFSSTSLFFFATLQCL